MRNRSKSIVVLATALAAVILGPYSVTAQIAVKGETVYPVSGAPIPDGVVLISNGKIEQVGPAAQVAIPDGYRVIEGAVVTPGFVDARTVAGLAGILNQPHDQDQLETSNPMQPDLRAIDAYNPREELVEWIREMGVTTIHTGHAPGGLISGQTMIVKTTGSTLEQALVDSVTMVAFTLGPAVSRNFNSPGTRSKAVAMLRSQLLKADEYRRKRSNDDPDERPTRDIGLEVLADVLDRRIPALVSAQRATEIMTALRLSEEFGFDLVLDGAAEAYLVLDEIRAAGVPIFIHPTMVRPSGDTENAAFDTASKLADAGIPFAFQSGFEGYVPKTRVVHLEAGVSVQYGLPFDRALAALTIEPARLLKINDRVGSLEVGKDADVAVFSGDPFEYVSRTCAVIIDGNVVSESCR